VHFCPYSEIVRGKPKKGEWLGKIKTNGANSPLTLHSTQITSIHLHTPPVPTLTILFGPHDGVVVRDYPNVPLFLTFKKMNHVPASF